MLLLDLNDDNELTVNIRGSKDDFYKELDYIKKINGSTFDPETKLWKIPRSYKVIKQLYNKFHVGANYNIYKLAGLEEPKVNSAVDLFIDDINQDVNTYVENKKLDDLKLGLKDFQKLGVATANYYLENKGKGFLIGDDMGLGKTPMSLACMNSFKKRNKADKFLVICPKNVKFQWDEEIEKFTNLSSIVVDGYNKQKRLSCYKKDVDIYIINPGLLILDDFEYIKNLNIDFIVVDEAHYFKNHGAQRTQQLKKLESNYKLALTGTPLQNRPDDTHSIYEFILPEYLPDWNDFRKKYMLVDFSRGYPIPMGYKNLFDLKKKVSTKMIRRKTGDVADQLPELAGDKAKTHWLDMDRQQRVMDLYLEDIVEESKEEIRQLRTKKNNISSNTKQRKVAQEIEDLEGKIMGLKNIQKEISDDLRLLPQSDSNWVSNMVYEQLDSCQHIVNGNYKSPKTKKLLNLVEKILDYNDEFKIIIFSQFARMVRMLKEDLSELEITNKIALIDGALSEKQRNVEKRKFIEDKNCRIIVLSDAGCQGYNLQRASHIINFDLPWNPAIIDQRIGRIKRIGSRWDTIYATNLLSKDSIDEQVVNTVERKREYFNRIIENTKDQDKVIEQVMKEII